MESTLKVTTPPRPFIYSPIELSEKYRDSLHSSLDGLPLNVSGFYKDNDGLKYSGYYYDELLGKIPGEKLTLKMPEELKSKLIRDGYFQFSGFVERAKSKNFPGVQFYFRVARIENFDETKQKITSTDYGVLKKRIDQGFIDIQLHLSRQLRKRDTPALLIVTGNQSIVDSDFSDALAEAARFYEVSYLRLGILSLEELMQKLDHLTLSKNELLVFMRGGGIGLEIFDSMDLCKKVMSLKTPFVTALGHEVNKHLLDQISDLSMPTPTAFGIFLRDIANQINVEGEELKLKDNRILNNERELAFRNQELQKKNFELQQSFAEIKRGQQEFNNQRKNLYYIIAGILALLILSLWLK